MPGPTTPHGLPANAIMAGLEPAGSHLLAREAGGALLTGATTPTITAEFEIEWAGSTTGPVLIPFQSGLILPRTAGGFGVRVYMSVPAGAHTVVMDITMAISVGSIGSATAPTFTPTTFTRTIVTVPASLTQFVIDQDDAGVKIFESLPTPVVGAASVMVLHGVTLDVTSNDTVVTVFGVGIRAA